MSDDIEHDDLEHRLDDMLIDISCRKNMKDRIDAAPDGSVGLLIMFSPTTSNLTFTDDLFGSCSAGLLLGVLEIYKWRLLQESLAPPDGEDDEPPEAV